MIEIQKAESFIAKANWDSALSSIQNVASLRIFLENSSTLVRVGLNVCILLRYLGELEDASSMLADVQKFIESDGLMLSVRDQVLLERASDHVGVTHSATHSSQTVAELSEVIEQKLLAIRLRTR